MPGNMMDDADLDEVVNDVVVGRLRTLGGDEFVAEALGLFLTTARRLVTDANEGLSGGELHPVLRAGHTMRGSAGNVGATRVYRAASVLERAAKDDELETSRDLTARLGTALEEFEAEVRSRGWLSSSPRT
jgi:HPt (histidine-containing phosphotransfer) domain-containing protein